MQEVFYTKKYDNKTAIINGEEIFTFKDLKKQIAYEIENIKNKKENIIILTENNYSFIKAFWAGIFCGKKIYILTDKQRINELTEDFDIIENVSSGEMENYQFPKINEKNSIINFYTSGSSGTPKIIKKSLYNLLREAEDIEQEFNLKNKDYSVTSTTTMRHLFGLTFHLMLPFHSGLTIYTKTISYPENADKKNNILISTPAFLSSISKHNITFKICPEYIISAGSKLDEKVFKNLQTNSKIIEIYGSTETGIIAYKTSYDRPFELFKNVSVKVNKDNTEVASDYIYENKILINDKIEMSERKIFLKNRTDRMFKIQEKRISAEEAENRLNEHDFVNGCFITKNMDKLVCLCALSQSGQKYLLQNGISSLIKQLKQHLLKYFEIIPQKWKFIDTIPMTSAGKVNQKLINKIFNVNLSLPVILARNISENCIIYKIFFYKNCNFFNGHFPEFKLTPGVFQLYMAKEFANAHFGLNLGEGQWKRIKFSNIIPPDSIINLKLEKTDKQVVYEYFSDDKKYASGVFLCENIFKEK